MPLPARVLRIAGAVLALVLGAVLAVAALRWAVHGVGRELIAGDAVRGFWLGTVLAGIAWVPAGIALLRRWRTDRSLYVAVGWGALVVLAHAVPGPEGERYLALVGHAPSWLLLWTLLLATWLAYGLTRRRTRAVNPLS